MSTSEPKLPPSPPFAVILTSTHSTGKETLAFSLASHLSTPWLKAEQVHASAFTSATSQSSRGLPNLGYNDVFTRIWLSKLDRLGYFSLPSRSAVLTCYAMRRRERDAIREAMSSVGLRVLFVVLWISEEVLEGRTLGAEEEALAGRIMMGKKRDIEMPGEEELVGRGGDVMVVDSLRSVEEMDGVVKEGLGRWLAGRKGEVENVISIE
ncbi:hypothetical protein QBC34DRAFT_362196 [Podospora aff. communis PSN243]|uniref:Uncharacterized protein n=1 Tax=Podospora aff. communis PSN243 TaxID=3040156 RepID=A0AAV9G4G9_9PEZI|nr:hypothetical protein QBC34DRAFT_362196 [Podospora aff. communis PSN243]